MAKRRVLIAVGGTGGHVFPAVALAQQLKKMDPTLYLLFVGEGLSENRCFDSQSFPYQEVSSGYFPLGSPLHCLRSCGKVMSGLWKSRRILREFKPDLVIGFGSFHTLPVLLAAKMEKIPFFLHESNTIPGKVNRLLARHAVMTGVQFPQTAQRLRGQVIPVALPLREFSAESCGSQQSAREYFNLDGSTATLLIFGGSQGANVLNGPVASALARGNLAVPVQVIHLAGNSEQAQKVRRCYADGGVVACVKEFEKEMGLAWRAADCAIARAGAATLAEQLHYEVPSILIPYPYAADDHQESNASLMAEVIGGAVKIEEEFLSPERLVAEVNQLFAEGGKRLAALRRSLRSYKSVGKAQELCSIVEEFLNRESSKEKR